MKELTKKEILEELKKLGVNSRAELLAYLREYEKYCVLNKCADGSVAVNTFQESISLRYTGAIRFHNSDH